MTRAARGAGEIPMKAAKPFAGYFVKIRGRLGIFHLTGVSHIELLKNYPDVMSVTQLSKALNVGRNSAYALMQAGTIAHRKIGRKYLIPKLCVLDYLNAARYNSAVMAGESNCHERSQTNDR